MTATTPSLPTSYTYWHVPEVSKRSGPSSLLYKTANDATDALQSRQPNDALVRIHAVSLNYRDYAIAKQTYPAPTIQSAYIPGSDAAGEVVAIGKAVMRVRVGDRVVANFTTKQLRGYAPTDEERLSGLGGQVEGVLSQYRVLPDAVLAHIPDHLTYAQASTLPCAAVTAWNSLFGIGDLALQSDQAALLEGTGGVSVFGAQFAIASGARAIITSSSDDNLAILRSLFDDEQNARLTTINYRTHPQWHEQARKATHNGEGVQHVLDVGGGGTVEQAFKSLKRGGVVTNIGFLTGQQQDRAQPNIIALTLANTAIYRGVVVGSRDHLEDMLAFISQHRIVPLIDRTFAFDKVPEAYEYIARGQHVGKIVVNVSEG